MISIPPFADCDFPLIKALRDAGHEVYYIVRLAPFFDKTTLLEFEKIQCKSGIYPASSYSAFAMWHEWLDLDKVFVSNDSVGKTGWASFRLFLSEWRLIDRIKPDVVHYVNIPNAFHFPLLLKYKKKSLCVVHDPIPHSGEGSFRDTIKRMFLPYVCSKFVLLNHLQDEVFCRKWHVSPQRIFHASLGPYTCYTVFGKTQVPGPPFILFMGRFSPYKGIDFALKAFNRIRDRFPEVRLVIAGAGPICFDTKLYSGKNDVEILHRYLTVKEVADYVSSAKFVVCPYTDATQSGVIQTSFALCTPVVATRVGNFSEVVEDGITGLLVPPRDVEGLSMAFGRLLGDAELLEKMRENIAKRNSEGGQSWKAIAGKYVEVYSR